MPGTKRSIDSIRSMDSSEEEDISIESKLSVLKQYKFKYNGILLKNPGKLEVKPGVQFNGTENGVIFSGNDSLKIGEHLCYVFDENRQIIKRCVFKTIKGLNTCLQDLRINGFSGPIGYGPPGNTMYRQYINALTVATKGLFEEKNKIRGKRARMATEAWESGPLNVLTYDECAFLTGLVLSRLPFNRELSLHSLALFKGLKDNELTAAYGVGDVDAEYDKLFMIYLKCENRAQIKENLINLVRGNIIPNNSLIGFLMEGHILLVLVVIPTNIDGKEQEGKVYFVELQDNYIPRLIEFDKGYIGRFTYGPYEIAHIVFLGCVPDLYEETKYYLDKGNTETFFRDIHQLFNDNGNNIMAKFLHPRGSIYSVLTEHDLYYEAYASLQNYLLGTDKDHSDERYVDPGSFPHNFNTLLEIDPHLFNTFFSGSYRNIKEWLTGPPNPLKKKFLKKYDEEKSANRMDYVTKKYRDALQVAPLMSMGSKKYKKHRKHNKHKLKKKLDKKTHRKKQKKDQKKIVKINRKGKRTKNKKL
jgi:hypothetical protein